MADIIQLLPDHVANQIAAGEVVQRPSSVVKELLENAIDSGAAFIQLIVKDAGKTLIQVIDDGMGMSVTDARLSLERHATSKIRTADDLFNIHTKGFRGEALASIAAIAHMEMKTKRDVDDIGTSIKIEGSEVLSQEPDVVPTGTSVAVKNLFYNVPARRNFLKSEKVELRHIIDEFHRVALAHPNIEFKFHHNDSELFGLPETNMRQRIVNAFGPKTNEKLVPVDEDTEIVKITGFVGKPRFAKKTRGEQFFFVNDRYIKSPYLNHAVNSAFEGLIKDGVHASYFLFLTVDPHSIDINIHPTKTEIKFEDDHSIYAILRATVRHSLGQFNVAPVLDFERDSSMDTPYSFKDKAGAQPKVDVDRNFNPFSFKSPAFGRGFGRKKQQDWESLYIGLESKGNDNRIEMADMQFESDEISSTMFDDQDTKPVIKTFQIQNKYIVKAIKSGFVVINQNRAHQRILYESYLEQFTIKDAISQQLLFPKPMNFSRSEAKILSGIQSYLEQAGFVFDALEKDNVSLAGIPVGMEDDQIETVLNLLISDVEKQIPESHFSQSDLIAKSLAGSMGIKTGKRLTDEEQEYLVDKLFACKEPAISPFNTPTYITMRVEDLDKKFNV
ncbi:MAG: DNA mismatch repair endonuclease MutL [Bacteroidia bacterium]|nr:DNA mismatch repair endonuclease MutL [Bacteroidia bacterium]NNK71653.1 DNA mismatch repair endonuclease MutL [Flavobacteriaceae bacterium]